ncbi:MAG: ABC transporter ATP-binding protein, partial [Acidimicrobiia bacterium]|nr:ABC transporter ATP-binding protein [Acidimicrobiia bacterium]
RAKALLNEVGLSERARTAIGGYSRGMRQRLGIARSLVNDPAVVFLDEPTLGLDPRGQQELLNMIRRIARDRNVAIVLCSHALVEVEHICDEVVILNHGDVIASGSVADVIGAVGGSMGPKEVRRVRVASADVADATSVLQGLPALTNVAASSDRDGWIRVEVVHEEPDKEGDGTINNEILGTLIGRSIPILGFEANAGRLEDVFLELTQDVNQ